MATKYMAIDAYVAPDSAISTADIDKLEKITDANEQFEAAKAICKRWGVEFSKTDNYTALKSKLDTAATEKATTISTEGPTSVI